MDTTENHFYRCHSGTSAGGLISGKGRSRGRQLLNDQLYLEFTNHMDKWAKNPTALVSVSTRLIDTLQRAFYKYYEDEEDPDQIWIVFIRVPPKDVRMYHHAEALARKFGCPEPSKKRYEYVFEWAIPEDSISHKISVSTLIRRGFDLQEFFINGRLPRTSELRDEFSNQILDPTMYSTYEIGRGLGHVARCFGARAPLHRITLQLLLDCTIVRDYDHDRDVFTILLPGNREVEVEAEYLTNIELGIDEDLMEGWLADTKFFHAYTKHCAWAAELRDSVGREWVLAEGVMWGDDTTRRRKEQEIQKLKDQVELQIEQHAIEIGL